MASERTLYSALTLYKDESFRAKRAEEYPTTIAEYDARAAVFEAMLAEGRFDETDGQPMTADEQIEFDVLVGAILKMST